MNTSASPIFEIIYNTVNHSDSNLSVSRLCDLAQVSRSGYYAWLKARPAREAAEKRDRRDFDLILWAYRQRGYSKGAKGIKMCLLHHDPPINMNLKKIRRLMKKYHLICPVRMVNPYRKIAKAIQENAAVPNILNREFEEYGPRIVLLTDITFLKYNGTFAYLSTILDAFTKEILAYAVSPSIEVDFVLETVNMLIEKHGVSLTAETIIHSDQGGHYKSKKFIEIIQSQSLRRSMSRKGNCWDNAPQESFFGHMKDAVADRIAECIEFTEVKEIVDDYIDYYNNERYQWDLAKLSPSEYYNFCMTGEYPIDIEDSPEPPFARKDPSELGADPAERRAEELAPGDPPSDLPAEIASAS